MKLQPGDRIRITKADDVCAPDELNYSVNKAFNAVWDGKHFLGCLVPFTDPTHRAAWSIDVMNHYQAEIQERPEIRTNIDCMFEQLTAAGMLP